MSAAEVFVIAVVCEIGLLGVVAIALTIAECIQIARKRRDWPRARVHRSRT